MKFFSVTFFGLAAAFSYESSYESSYLPYSYYTEDGSMIFWKFPSDSSRIEYYLENISSLQPGQSVYEMWYWANNAKVRDGTNETNYPRLEALKHGISDLKLHANTIDGWESFPSCDGPNCCVGPDCVTTEVTVEDLDMETMMKQMCTSINYAILSAANPIDYPALVGSPLGDGVFFQDGENCNSNGMVVYDCDCSDAENYSFADQDVCETFDTDYEMPQSIQQGMDTLKSLVCEDTVEEWSEEEWSEDKWYKEEWSEDKWYKEEWSEDKWYKEEWSEDKWYGNEEMEEKRSCRIINYAILSEANPTNYPALHTGLGHPSNFVQVGDNCNTGFELALNCDCSNAADYSFADQELCHDLKQQTESEFFEISVPQSVQPGLNKLKSLVCGNEVVDEDILTDAECTDAQKKLKAEENFIQKGFLRMECESACAEFPNEKCGFLINGVSMILFAMLAMLKY